MTAITDYGGQHLVTFGDKAFKSAGHYASPEFLQMLDFDLKQGQPDQVLSRLNSIVITESLATALFGKDGA